MTAQLTHDQMRSYVHRREQLIDKDLGNRILRLVHAGDSTAIHAAGRVSIDLNLVADETVAIIWNMVASHEAVLAKGDAA